MLKTIVIPTDLSNNYNNSLNMALLLEKHVPLDIVLSFSNGIDTNQAQAKFNEINNQYGLKIQNTPSAIRYEVDKDLSGDNCGDINPIGNDTIVLLNHFKNAKSGTLDLNTENTVKMIRSCRQNYVVVPENNVPLKATKIVFPVHILTKVRHKVTFTAVIAKMFNAEVHVITLQSTNQKEIVKRLNLYTLQIINHLKNFGVKTQFDTVEGKNIPDLIVDYSKSVSADLISVIPEEIKGPRLFSKGYLHEIIEQTEIPLIVVAPRKAKITGSFSASG